MGIRVARELEHPSEDEAEFTDANGNVSTAMACGF